MLYALILLLSALAQPPELTLRFVGNAGLMLTDGRTSLMVDLPYQSGAFRYMRYDVSALDPPGLVVSLITHRHADHYDRGLFLDSDWLIVGPSEITDDVPAERVIESDPAARVGAFRVEAFSTPHSDTEHYSYLITWRGRRIYVPGDTEDASNLLEMTDLDVAFVTSWLSCAVTRSRRLVDAERMVLYHQFPAGTERTCGHLLKMQQGDSFTLAGR